MKCFSFIKKGAVHLEGSKKVVKGEELSELLSAKEIVDLAKEDAVEFRKKTEEECEELKKQAEKKGFEEGLSKWSDQLKHLESEISNVRSEMQKSILPLTMAAIRKIIGKEIEVHPEIIVDIVATALKRVAQHRKIAIFVRKADLDAMENQRPRLKALFENLQSLTIAARDDIEEGSCVIETEKGIINVSLESQFKAIESAFGAALKVEEKEEIKEEVKEEENIIEEKEESP